MLPSMRRWIAPLCGLWLAGFTVIFGARVSADDAMKAAAETITDAELKRHVQFLASDTLQGREAGTHGGYAASSYIVDQLRKSGVSAAQRDGDYFQYFHPNFRNVLAVIPGSDEILKSEYILVGGHYDHVGFGNRFNSRGPIGVIHNGADDNASGTAGILEVAQAIAGLETPLKRSILIVFWDAEEKGLLGSKHYAEFPVVPLEQIKLHFNADMIGRLRPEGFEISGWRTGAGLRRFLARQNLDGLTLRFMYTYKPESDHWPFFQRRVPSLMLHTGKHADYHRPSDDTHLVNFKGVRQTSRFILHCAIAAANADSLPAFREQSLEEDETVYDRLLSKKVPPINEKRLRLGVSYDGELAKQRIVRVTFVEPESPAARAGLKSGDRILKVGRQAVNEAESFRTLVMNAPSPTTLEVRRGEETLMLEVSLRDPDEPFGMTWQSDDAEPDSLIVTHVAPDSKAERAGFKPEQRIVSVNGQNNPSSDDLRRLTEASGETRFEVELELAGRFQTIQLSETASTPNATTTASGE